jgi:predicted dehydrogenase
MVGYTLRFHEPLQVLRDSVRSGVIGRILYARAEVGQYLPDWRPHLLDYRQSVTARKELGGGVLLELSHEFDYLRWILGDFRSAWGRVDRIGDLDIDVEDIAEVVLTGQNGEMISVHLDMLQRAGSRSCQIHGTEGSLMWKSSSQSIEQYVAKERVWRTVLAMPNFDRNGMYLHEIQHFFRCVETRQEPQIGYLDGRRALEVVAAVKRSSAIGNMLPL